jgi:hypothetical protein
MSDDFNKRNPRLQSGSIKVDLEQCERSLFETCSAGGELIKILII